MLPKKKFPHIPFLSFDKFQWTWFFGCGHYVWFLPPSKLPSRQPVWRGILLIKSLGNRICPGNRWPYFIEIGFLLKQRTDRFVIDEQTGERLVINLSKHSFFFIPMHWAGIVIALLGIGAAIADIFVNLE